jgi:hypothetical protein
MEIMSPFTKEISGVSAFNYQQASVAGNMFFSVVSVFYAGDSIEEKPRWYDIELARFDQLVAIRKEYLDMLPSLNKNWISGNSSLPSRAVIEKSKKLLDDFNRYLVQRKQQRAQIDVPKLVMGPIPVGGMGIEFHINSENVLYVSIFNDSRVEIELKYFDFYATIELTEPNRRITADYELLSRTNRNSVRENSLPVLQSTDASSRSNRNPYKYF